MREETERAAQLLINEKLAETERTHQELQVTWQKQFEEAEVARKAAEDTRASLQAEVQQVRQDNAAALDTLQKDREAEVAKLKEDAADEVTRIRREATDAVETRMRGTLAAHEKAMAAAHAKALETENKLVTLSEQHTAAIAESLNVQREAMEKAKDDAVNSEKAKAFEESQKLSIKVNDLQRALEKKTNEELGEGAEIDLLEALKKEFPTDRINPIAKGAPGADILHIIMLHGNECGTIIYDSKNHLQFRYEHVTKLKADQLAAKAEHAILSTHKFPQGTRQLHMHDGILIANPARVVLIAALIRQHLLQVHTLRLSGVEREGKTVALYEFITSERCTQLLGRVEARAEELLGQQAKEIKWHENNWKKQGEAIRAIQKAKAEVESEINGIIGTAAGDNVIPEAP